MQRSFENPINRSIKIRNGCKGCGGRWDDRSFHEGQCLKCKRCLNCCGDKTVQYSCGWNYEREYGGYGNAGKRIAHERRSKRATEIYHGNPTILATHRRMF